MGKHEAPVTAATLAKERAAANHYNHNMGEEP